MPSQQNTAVYSASPPAVIAALSSVLVERGELAGDAAPEVAAGALASLESRDEAQISSDSRELSSGELRPLVVEDARRYVTDEGGRYVVNIAVEPADTGTRVTVTPTLVAYVPGLDGPLGGRPLPSNGTLERAILAAISEHLQPSP